MLRRQSARIFPQPLQHEPSNLVPTPPASVDEESTPLPDGKSALAPRINEPNRRLRVVPKDAKVTLISKASIDKFCESHPPSSFDAHQGNRESSLRKVKRKFGSSSRLSQLVHVASKDLLRGASQQREEPDSTGFVDVGIEDESKEKKNIEKQENDPDISEIVIIQKQKSRSTLDAEWTSQAPQEPKPSSVTIKSKHAAKKTPASQNPPEGTDASIKHKGSLVLRAIRSVQSFTHIGHQTATKSSELKDKRRSVVSSKVTVDATVTRSRPCAHNPPPSAFALPKRAAREAPTQSPPSLVEPTRKSDSTHQTTIVAPPIASESPRQSEAFEVVKTDEVKPQAKPILPQKPILLKTQLPPLPSEAPNSVESPNPLEPPAPLGTKGFSSGSGIRWDSLMEAQMEQARQERKERRRAKRLSGEATHQPSRGSDARKRAPLSGIFDTTPPDSRTSDEAIMAAATRALISPRTLSEELATEPCRDEKEVAKSSMWEPSSKIRELESLIAEIDASSQTSPIEQQPSIQGRSTRKPKLPQADNTLTVLDQPPTIDPKLAPFTSSKDELVALQPPPKRKLKTKTQSSTPPTTPSQTQMQSMAPPTDHLEVTQTIKAISPSLLALRAKQGTVKRRAQMLIETNTQTQEAIPIPKSSPRQTFSLKKLPPKERSTDAPAESSDDEKCPPSPLAAKSGLPHQSPPLSKASISPKPQESSRPMLQRKSSLLEASEKPTTKRALKLRPSRIRVVSLNKKTLPSVDTSAEHSLCEDSSYQHVSREQLQQANGTDLFQSVSQTVPDITVLSIDSSSSYGLVVKKPTTLQLGMHPRISSETESTSRADDTFDFVKNLPTLGSFDGIEPIAVHSNDSMTSAPQTGDSSSFHYPGFLDVSRESRSDVQTKSISRNRERPCVGEKMFQSHASETTSGDISLLQISPETEEFSPSSQGSAMYEPPSSVDSLFEKPHRLSSSFSSTASVFGSDPKNNGSRGNLFDSEKAPLRPFSIVSASDEGVTLQNADTSLRCLNGEPIKRTATDLGLDKSPCVQTRKRLVPKKKKSELAMTVNASHPPSSNVQTKRTVVSQGKFAVKADRTLDSKQLDIVDSTVNRRARTISHTTRWEYEVLSKSSKIGRYVALHHEAEDELIRSRTIWVDTAFSTYTISCFVPPTKPAAIQVFLDHSRQFYLPLPREILYSSRRQIRERLSSFKSISVTELDTNSQVERLSPKKPTKLTTVLDSPAPLLDVAPFSPFVDPFTAPAPTESKPVMSVRIRLTSGTRRLALSENGDNRSPKREKGQLVVRKKKSQVKKENTEVGKEVESNGSLKSADGSLRISRPRPRRRPQSLFASDESQYSDSIRL